MREDGVLEVWVGTETPDCVKMNASSIAGVDQDQIEVHVTFAGGSFGLRVGARIALSEEAFGAAGSLGGVGSLGETMREGS